jgi:putative Holliday junction resolvase
MKILGIDYGERKIGLAMAETKIAEPLLVIRYKKIEELKNKILQIQPDKIIVGISEGKTAKKTREFVKELQKEIEIPIELHDESLSTQEAQRLTIEAGLKRSKRKKFEDAFAATVMLQDYLDNFQV